MKIFVVAVLLFGSSFLAETVSAEDGAEVTLGATVVGNQEQPKVLYIIPWQAPDGPEGFDRNFNSELNTLFEPVERDEFRRHLQILQQVDQTE